ncbi:hypothetical protein RY27_29870 [Litorilinea aerophila]|nr:hypothetical protein RY27_29870 [Litorilinea aerophila]
MNVKTETDVWDALWRRVRMRVDPYLLLLLGLSLFALSPLTAPGYFYEAHDGRHSVFYLLMFDASIRDGALWPRWAMHHIQGYGYPTFILQAPLGFYLGELFILLGAGYTLAAKLTWAVGFLAGAWGIYRLLCHWLESSLGGERPANQMAVRLAGVVAGLLYVYAPYHLVDIYVRAALNDSLLLGWFPWVFLAFDRLIALGDAPGWPRRLALAILALGGVLLTHTFALLSFLPLLMTFVLFRLGMLWLSPANRKLAPFLLAGAAGVGGLLLTGTFLLPLLAEGPYLQQQVYVTNTYDFRNHFIQLGQYFSPFWGYGYSDDPQGANDGMSFQVGLVPLVMMFVSVTLLWRRKELGRETLGLLVYLLAVTVGLLFVMTPWAAPLWEAFPPLAVIQFPWRLLALVVFTSSALGGLVVWRLASDYMSYSEEARGGVLVLGLLVAFASYSYVYAQLQPVEPWREDGRAVYRFEEEHPDMIAYTQWVQEPFTQSPMSPDYAAEDYREDYSENGRLTRLSIVQGSGEVVSQYSRGSSAGGVVRLDGPATVRIHLLYFPGWQVWVDGMLVPHRVSDPYGLIEVDVPAGEHRIDVRMGATPARRLGTLLSWGMVLVVLGLWWWPRQ